MHTNREKTKITRIYPAVLQLNIRKWFVFLIIFNPNDVKVKQSRYRPGVDQRVPGI